jgi:hypothetical protein
MAQQLYFSTPAGTSLADHSVVLTFSSYPEVFFSYSLPFPSILLVWLHQELQVICVLHFWMVTFAGSQMGQLVEIPIFGPTGNLLIFSVGLAALLLLAFSKY